MGACCGGRVHPELGVFGTAAAFAGNNAVQIEASAAEMQLKSDCPQLLLDGEEVVMAFKGRGGAGRDDYFFTTKRVLMRDVRGVSGKSITYISFPYASMKSFSIETAGGGLDGDCSLRFSVPGKDYLKMDFVRSVDIFAIARFFNAMVLTDGRVGAHVPGGAQPTDDAIAEPDAQSNGNILDWLGGNARQLNAKDVEDHLNAPPLQLLIDGETVEMAFKCGRDSFVLTSKRILRIDVKGLSGKAVEYESILWECVRAFSVETAGYYFDRDATLILFLSELGRLEQDLRKGQCDIMAIQKYLADKVLGTDTKPTSPHAVANTGERDSGPSWLAWLGNDSRMIDATEADTQFHSQPPILQGSEKVEMAFKGRRDIVLFTTKRLLIADMKGWTQSKVNYISVPWSSVQAFGVRSAGAFLDKDAEMMIWTDVDDITEEEKIDQTGTAMNLLEGDVEPDVDMVTVPRMSFIELDFQKDQVDLMAVHRYLSARCMPLAKGGYMTPDMTVPNKVLQPSPQNGVELFLSWLGDDAQAVDADAVDTQLHTTNPVLQDDEKVVMAFGVLSDLIAFTTKRVLFIAKVRDLTSLFGMNKEKVVWRSIPYPSIRAFAVESAGAWDRDAQLSLELKIYWDDTGNPGSTISQDFRKGKADIMAIQTLLAAQVIGADDGSSTNVAALAGGIGQPTAGLGDFLSWVSDDAHEINAEAVDTKLREDTKILQHDEKVDMCFKIGRDLCIFTTKRVIYVDVKGWSGQKVRYESYPLAYCTAFSVKSSGMIGFLDSANQTLFTSIPGAPDLTQDLSSSNTDIWELQTLMAKKILLRGGK